MSAPAALASFAAFVDHLGERCSLGPGAAALADPDADLADDLGLDSLALLELVLVLDDLGLVLDDADLARCRTTGALYRRAVGAAGAGTW